MCIEKAGLHWIPCFAPVWSVLLACSGGIGQWVALVSVATVERNHSTAVIHPAQLVSQAGVPCKKAALGLGAQQR